MSGPLTVAPWRTDIRQRRDRAPRGDTREAPGALETIGAGFRATVDEQVFWQDSRLDRAYGEVVQALRERDGNRKGDYATDFLSPGNWNPLRRGRVYDADKVWRAVEAYRRLDPEAFADLGTRDEFERKVLRRDGGRDADRDTLDRGSRLAAFAGGMAGEFTDPVNIASLPIGGVGKSIGTRMLTEGLINAGVEVVQVPFRSAGREALGEELTMGEAALNIAAAGAGGALLRGAIDVAPGAARAIDAKVVQPVRRMIDPDAPSREFARAFADMVPPELRTPEQEAALFVVNRAAEVEQASPFARTFEGLDAHVAKMQTAMEALAEGRLPSRAEIAAAGTSFAPRAPLVDAAVSGAARGLDFAGIKAAIRGPESGGNDRAVNRAGSSASGRYQFIEGTFVDLYRREYGVNEAAARAAWEANRFDTGVQERLMDRLLTENAAALERAGITADPGNLYLAHFAGVGKAIELIRAPREAPVADFFSPRAIAQNRAYLGDGKTVGEAIDIIRGKVGDAAQVTPRPISPEMETPPLRDPRLDAARPADALEGAPVRVATELPPEVGGLIDPLMEVVATPGRSLNRLGELASELGTDEATLRQALEALVERGDIVQNSQTGAFMRKAAARDAAESGDLPAAERAYRVEVRTFAQVYGEAAALSPAEANARLRIVNGRSGQLIEQSRDGNLVSLEFRSDGSSALIDMTIRKDGVAEIDVDGFEGGRVAEAGLASPNANRFGPAITRDAFRQLQVLYPEVARFEGKRITGAGAGRVQSIARSPARLDALAAARARADHSDLPPDPDPRFAEPDGEGIRATAESVWHDIRVAGDELLGGRLADERFDLGDGKGERTAMEIRAELDADKAAIEAMRACLT